MHISLPALVAAGATAISSHAQALNPPPLLPGESVVVTKSGCAVVARPLTRAEANAGRSAKDLNAFIAGFEYDKACKPGELLVGPVAMFYDSLLGKTRGAPQWFDFGRRFGIEEYDDGRPRIDVTWGARAVSFPLGIDTPEALGRLVEKHGITVRSRNGESETEIYVSKIDTRGLFAPAPAKDEGWRFLINDDTGQRKQDCGDIRACFALWQQHVAPLVEEGKRFLADARPQIEARKVALAAHLRSQGAPLAATDPRAESRLQAWRDRKAIFVLENAGLPTQSGFTVDIYQGTPTCQAEPVRVVAESGRTGADPSVHEVQVDARVLSFVMRAQHPAAGGGQESCEPGAFTLSPSAGTEYRAVFREEGRSCWVQVTAVDRESGQIRRLPLEGRPVKVDASGRHSCEWGTQ
jgi:hypothetical protein